MFLSLPWFDVGYGGSLGGGKTAALIHAGLRFVHNPNHRALFLRRTYPELQGVMDKAIAEFRQLGAEWVASEKRFKFPSGATYEFGYLETHKDVQQYVGQEYTYVAFDQLEQLPEERTWDVLLTRIRSTDPTITLMARSSFNPGGAGHGWIKRRYIIACPPDGTPIIDKEGNTRAFVQATLYDNPVLLKNDPMYEKRLLSLPEQLRDQMLYGKWDVGEGIAFPGLTDKTHTVPASYEIDRHWQIFGAFDWGYGHRWAFLLLAIKPDGVIRVVDSVMGRRQVPDEIAERVADLLQAYGLHFHDLTYTVAGSDTKIQDRARGTWGPSIAEQFAMRGWVLTNADQSRIAGYQNALMYLHQRKVEFAATRGNMAGLEQLMELATDPDSPNDVLKVDVDPMTGLGGDDWYDAWRYGLMSRPIAKVLPIRKSHHIENAPSLKEMIEGKKDTTVPWAVRMPAIPMLPSGARTHTESV